MLIFLFEVQNCVLHEGLLLNVVGFVVLIESLSLMQFINELSYLLIFGVERTWTLR